MCAYRQRERWGRGNPGHGTVVERWVAVGQSAWRYLPGLQPIYGMLHLYLVPCHPIYGCTCLRTWHGSGPVGRSSSASSPPYNTPPPPTTEQKDRWVAHRELGIVAERIGVQRLVVHQRIQLVFLRNGERDGGWERGREGEREMTMTNGWGGVWARVAAAPACIEEQRVPNERAGKGWKRVRARVCGCA